MNLRPLQYISIQTTSVCTSACQYCPYPYAATTQNPGYMSDELFEKIILDIKEISPNFDGHYSAQLGNEPAADPKFLERTEFVYKTFPNIRINFPSNAQLLDKERGRKLIDLMFKYENMVDDRNHGGILVHFAGISEDSWKDVMDSTQDYYKTIDNIRNLISYNAELGRKYPNKACNINTHNWFEHPDPSQYLAIPMGITAYHKPENPELWPSLEKWEKLHNKKFQYYSEKEYLRHIDDLFFSYGPYLSRSELFQDRAGDLNLLGETHSKLAARKIDKDNSFECARFFNGRGLSVLYDGDVAVCCNDWTKRYTLGNLKTQTVIEVFYGKDYIDFMDMGTGRVPSPPDFICKLCRDFQCENEWL